MKIRISINDENADKILEEGMNCISRTAKDKPEWKKQKTCDCFETECDVSEDDNSAQWWGTTRIRTEHHPGGTATLSIDSSTHWF